MAGRAASAHPTCGYAWGAEGGPEGLGAVGAPGVAGIFCPGMAGAAGSSAGGSGSLQNGQVTGRKLGDTIFFPQAGQISGPEVVSGGLKHMAVPFPPRVDARNVVRRFHYRKMPTRGQTTNDPTPPNRSLRRWSRIARYWKGIWTAMAESGGSCGRPSSTKVENPAMKTRFWRASLLAIAKEERGCPARPPPRLSTRALRRLSARA